MPILDHFRIEKRKIKDIETQNSISSAEIDNSVARLDSCREMLSVENLICSICNRELYLPVVAFRCSHIFHDLCLDREETCMICTNEHEIIEEMMSSLTNGISVEGLLHKLENPSDRFSIIADSLSKLIL